jgi:endonuclease/exonuclease/phosphatase family metal-dependent hydrolase
MDAILFRLRSRVAHTCLVLAVVGTLLQGADARSVTVATYNLENYLATPRGSRPAKSAESRRTIRQILVQVKPDVLALQEIGGMDALGELQASLAEAGWSMPHREMVRGYDTNIFVALLSRIPLLSRQLHDQEGFLLRGKRFRTTRGILEAEFQPAPGYRFTLVAVHLKSRRESPEAAQDEIREEEARILRRLVEARLQRDPRVNLVLAGDLNDTKDSLPLRVLLGRGATALVDARPAERSDRGDAGAAASDTGLRRVTWTHFYAKEDSYSRVDYLLLSPGMARELDRAGTYVPAWPDWGIASDHRPVVARFVCYDR